jgi:hypothetical protein
MAPPPNPPEGSNDLIVSWTLRPADSLVRPTAFSGADHAALALVQLTAVKIKAPRSMVSIDGDRASIELRPASVARRTCMELLARWPDCGATCGGEVPPVVKPAPIKPAPTSAPRALSRDGAVPTAWSAALDLFERSGGQMTRAALHEALVSAGFNVTAKTAGNYLWSLRQRRDAGGSLPTTQEPGSCLPR